MTKGKVSWYKVGMASTAGRLFALVFAALVTSCAATAPSPARDGSSPSSDASTTPLPDGGSVATCVASEGTCAGTLAPEALGVGIRAVPSKSSMKLGRHYFCYPASVAAFRGRLLIHLVGTFSDPQVDQSFSRRACAFGFAVISPMYENEIDARSACGADLSCFEGFRNEIVQGGDFAPNVAVDTQNGLLNRINTLLQTLSTTESTFPAWKTLAASVAAGDFSSVTLSGHSQGSGHALFLAREFATQRVVLLAGPSDRVYTPSNAAAEWIERFTIQSKTASDKIYGYLSEDDTVQGFADTIDSWRLIQGAQESCNYANADTPNYPAACRRVILSSKGCAGLDAHTIVITERCSNACKPGMPPNRNTETWRFLLGSP
jgi:hypothetical protein